MERFSPVEIFLKKSNTFRDLSRYYLFTLFTETTEIFCTICLDYHCQASDQVERKRKIYRYFVNGTTQSRSVFCAKKNTSTIWEKFFTEISVKMVSALNLARTENVKEKLTKSWNFLPWTKNICWSWFLFFRIMPFLLINAAQRSNSIQGF